MRIARVVLAALILFATINSQQLAAQGAASISRDTRHLKFTATVTPRVAVPGERLMLAVDVVPQPGMHVYAPGTKYRAIKITIEPQAQLKIGETVYPPASSYYFKPLNETEPVYQAPFRLLVEMTAVEAERPRSPIVLKGALHYQACDDRVCYLPESIPLRWTLRLAS